MTAVATVAVIQIMSFEEGVTARLAIAGGKLRLATVLLSAFVSGFSCKSSGRCGEVGRSN